MVKAPETLEDLERLVATKAEEDVHLEFKRSTAFSRTSEISKDISAFANSDGGVVVYGIVEEDRVAIGIDDGCSEREMSSERLEQLIASNVSPRIEGLRIVRIALGSGGNAYSIEVPRSINGPHQDRHSHRYYRRYNFQAVPMEDWEIADIRLRRIELAPLIQVTPTIRQDVLCLLDIRNVGPVEARCVRFEIPSTVPWRSKERATGFFGREIPAIAPGQWFEIIVNASHVLLNERNLELATFPVTVSYDDPRAGRRVSTAAMVDFAAYLGTRVPKTDTEFLKDAVKEGLGNLTDAVSRLASIAAQFTPVVNGTGLSIAVSSLRRGGLLAAPATDAERIDPSGSGAAVFKEILGCSLDLACSLEQYFWNNRCAGDIQTSIPALTEEQLAELRKWFQLVDRPREFPGA